MAIHSSFENEDTSSDLQQEGTTEVHAIRPATPWNKDFLPDYAVIAVDERDTTSTTTARGQKVSRIRYPKDERLLSDPDYVRQERIRMELHFYGRDQTEREMRRLRERLGLPHEPEVEYITFVAWLEDGIAHEASKASHEPRYFYRWLQAVYADYQANPHVLADLLT